MIQDCLFDAANGRRSSGSRRLLGIAGIAMSLVGLDGCGTSLKSKPRLHAAPDDTEGGFLQLFTEAELGSWKQSGPGREELDYRRAWAACSGCDERLSRVATNRQEYRGGIAFPWPIIEPA